MIDEESRNNETNIGQSWKSIPFLMEISTGDVQHCR
jgi:hypothetical protein